MLVFVSGEPGPSSRPGRPAARPAAPAPGAGPRISPPELAGDRPWRRSRPSHRIGAPGRGRAGWRPARSGGRPRRRPPSAGRPTCAARTPAPRLPNVSYAGYRHGDRDVSGARRPRLVNVKQPPFGAAGDGATDDTAALRRAIDSVEAEGGVVYLPDGDYRVSGVLFVHGSGTVLRGESRARTRLLFTQTLDEALGAQHGGPLLALGMGGWAAVVRAAQPPELSLPAAGGRQSARKIWPGSSPGWARRGWPVGAAAGQGRRARRARRSDAGAGRYPPAPASGDLVFLVVPASEALLAAGWWRRRPSGGRWPIPGRDGIGGRALAGGDRRRRGQRRHPGAAAALRRAAGGRPRRTTAAPAPSWQAIPAGQTIRDVGVEQLTLVMQRRPAVGPRRRGRSPGRALRLEWSLLPQHRPRLRPPGHRGQRRPGAWRTMGCKNISLEEIELRSEGLPRGAAPPPRAGHPGAVPRRAGAGAVHGSPLARRPPRRLGLRALPGPRPLLPDDWPGARWIRSLTDLTDLGRWPARRPAGRCAAPADRLVGWNLRPRAERATIRGRRCWSPGLPANLYEAQRRLRLTSQPTRYRLQRRTLEGSAPPASCAPRQARRLRTRMPGLPTRIGGSSEPFFRQGCTTPAHHLRLPWSPLP